MCGFRVSVILVEIKTGNKDREVEGTNTIALTRAVQNSREKKAAQSHAPHANAYSQQHFAQWQGLAMLITHHTVGCPDRQDKGTSASQVRELVYRSRVVEMSVFITTFITTFLPQRPSFLTLWVCVRAVAVKPRKFAAPITLALKSSGFLHARTLSSSMFFELDCLSCCARFNSLFKKN